MDNKDNTNRLQFMKKTTKSNYSLGVDIGSSSAKFVIINSTNNDIFTKEIIYSNYSEFQDIWTQNNQIRVTILNKILDSAFFDLNKTFNGIKITTISFTGVGPSLVFLDKNGNPFPKVLAYATDFKKKDPIDFPKNHQTETGTPFSDAIPAIQVKILLNQNKIIPETVMKFTTLNDYVAWNLTDLSLDNIFSTLPNASYTGFYSLKNRTWNSELVSSLGFKKKVLPKIINLSTIYEMKREIQEKYPIFQHTKVVAGTLDGIDAFWATDVYPKDKIIVGSASTTGALRIWIFSPPKEFFSRQICCCHVIREPENYFVKLIPFNNVGSAILWFGKKYLTESRYFSHQRINFELLESKVHKRMNKEETNLSSYLSTLPVFFPYINGEPRGPMGRGYKIKGGFVTNNKRSDFIDLYIAVLLGIANMFRHNLEILLSDKEEYNQYKEIRLTGMVANKSKLFLRLLGNLTRKKITIMKNDQSVAVATALRSFSAVKIKPKLPYNVIKETFNPKAENNLGIEEVLNNLYSKYLKIYSESEI